MDAASKKSSNSVYRIVDINIQNCNIQPCKPVYSTEGDTIQNDRAV